MFPDSSPVPAAGTMKIILVTTSQRTKDIEKIQYEEVL